MCTVIVRVDESGGPVRMLAVRDEDPHRPWKPFGFHWAEHPEIVGVRDQLAGGAWLAADPKTERLGVIVNLDGVDIENPTTRGHLALGAALGEPMPETITTLGFHLVAVNDGEVEVTTWNGETASSQMLEPGTHVITHAPVDDMREPRTGSWLPAFAAANLDRDVWWREWAELLERSAETPNTAEHAIIRDNHVHGYPTITLLAAFLTIGAGEFDLTQLVLDEPGVWPAEPVWEKIL